MSAKMLCSYDDAWPQFFAAEADALRGIFCEALFAAHHMGSTSVPGMVAKPVIDILLELRSLEDADCAAPAMRLRGYDVRGAYGIEGRRYFSKPRGAGDPVGFHVHAYCEGSPQIERHLRFRDYLLAKPDVAHAYALLKLSLCAPDGSLLPDYQDRKADFVRRVDQLALSASGLR